MKEAFERVSARDVSARVRRILRLTRIPEKYIANGLFFDTALFIKLKNRRTGFYRREAIVPIDRFEKVYKIAVENLGPKRAHQWLLKPNPFLSDVSPILCLRTDLEAQKVIDLLQSIGFGLPA